MTDLKDKILGVIYGTAIGDALGWPVEFNSDVTPENPKVFHDAWPEQYTDDTQMFRAVCEGMLQWLGGDQRDGFRGIEQAADLVGNEFVKWSQSPENNRAPGRACMEGCRNLATNEIVWDRCGVDSGGCGTAMRSMAYGLFFYDDPPKAAEWAGHHSALTHTHRIAEAAAAAVGAGVAALLVSDVLSFVVNQMVRGLADFDSFTYADELAGEKRVGDMIREAQQTQDSPEKVLDKWRGWAGHEAVAASLYCFLKHPDDYEAAVLLAVNSPGDSDSLGAITGALVGARVGLSGIPAHWVREVEDSTGLYDLGERICARLGI